MKDAAKEQFGQELGPKTPEEYAAYRELAPQRPTFEDADHQTNSAGERYAGFDRNWDNASKTVSPQGDGKPGPITEISGGKDGNSKTFRRHSIVDVYLDGNYDPIRGRVPDEGKSFEASAPIGDPTLYTNQGVQSPASKRPIQIGWKKKYAQALSAENLAGSKAGK